MTGNQILISSEDSSRPLPEKTEERLTEALLQLMDELNLSQQSLSLHFCSRETSRQLNQSYRNRNEPTDLLSWRYDDAESPETEEEPWGELVYCLALIRQQAAASGWELEDELLRLTVHGLVHLLGYDHESAAEETEMLGIETELLEKIGLKGVYPD